MRYAASMDTIGRSTLVHFADRYFNWLLTTGDLFRLPLGISVRAKLLRDPGREFDFGGVFKKEVAH
jgi:hypothetical protein